MGLDLKDCKILNEIEMNARINYSLLGKKTGLSKQVVKYRIEILEKKKVIQGYFAIIDLLKLGFSIHVVYLKLQAISSKQQDLWQNQIDKHPAVMSTGKNAGEWDLTIVIKAQNNYELDKIFKQIIKGKEDKIKNKIITTQIESTYFTEKVFYDKEGKEATTNGGKNLKIDKIDEKLLKILGRDGRASLVNLSEKLKLTPNAIKHRLKQLENEKIIVGWKTKINYELLGFLHFRVFIHSKKMSEDFYLKVKNFLKQKGNIESISKYWGYADIDFRIHAKDIMELYKFISETKDAFIENIIDINSMIIVNWERINYYPE